jgi:protocatechuate 3,4-dioxygenase beta subunit
MATKVSPVSPDLISRRMILGRMGTALVALPVIPMLGCSSSSGTATNDGASSGTDAGRSASDGGNSASDSGALATDGGLVPAGFAVGSGAFLSGKDYGNPFTTGLGSTCVAYTAATKGPCHSNTYYRKDISDGLVGLPTRLELLVVDTSCNPVSNAIVEVWYASPAGTYSEAAQAIDGGTGYSGSLSDLNVGFCTGNNSDALASNWLRGYQYSGSDGRVTIDSIYPGWYAGRTTHVHFIVTANGKTYVTSQLLFDETLTTAVYTQHPSYKARGDKDTTNAKDMVAQGFSSLSSAIMSFSQQSDGAMVVWKAITIG